MTGLPQLRDASREDLALAVKSIGPNSRYGGLLACALAGIYAERAERQQCVDREPGKTTIYDEIQAERQRAHRKHGATGMESAPVDEMYRAVILGEEIGEMAEVVWALALVAAGGRVDTIMNDGRHAGEVNLADLRRELVQVATMAAAWADRIEVPTDDR